MARRSWQGAGRAGGAPGGNARARPKRATSEKAWRPRGGHTPLQPGEGRTGLTSVTWTDLSARAGTVRAASRVRNAGSTVPDAQVIDCFIATIAPLSFPKPDPKSPEGVSVFVPWFLESG
jgi:hypothetical protein